MVLLRLQLGHSKVGDRITKSVTASLHAQKLAATDFDCQLVAKIFLKSAIDHQLAAEQSPICL